MYKDKLLVTRPHERNDIVGEILHWNLFSIQESRSKRSGHFVPLISGRQTQSLENSYTTFDVSKQTFDVYHTCCV